MWAAGSSVSPVPLKEYLNRQRPAVPSKSETLKGREDEEASEYTPSVFLSCTRLDTKLKTKLLLGLANIVQILQPPSHHFQEKAHQPVNEKDLALLSNYLLYTLEGQKPGR